MRCRQCEYSLWNLTARQCPECGAPFRPSDFDFVCNSVRFCCPHCDQSYYGTGERGHLVPAEFDCVKCARRVHMDELVLRPAAGVEEGQTRVYTHPWIERPKGKWLMPWLRTVGKSMVSPPDMMRAVPIDHGTVVALGYAALTMFLIHFCGSGVPFVAFGLVIGFTDDWSEALEVFTIAGVATIAGPLASLVLIALWGLVTQGVLRATGGATYPIGRTYQALCYSTGANATSAVPCIGIYFSVVGLCWWVVSAVLMVAAGQRVHGGRAALATLALPCVLVLGGAGSLVGLVIWSFTQVPVVQAAVSDDAQCSLMLSSLTDHARKQGAWPAHAIALTGGGTISEQDYVGDYTDTLSEDAVVGDTTLENLAALPPGRRQEVIDAIGGRQPKDVVAHRVGDFVFTYHGIPPPGWGALPEHGDLWLVIMSPDPDLIIIPGSPSAVVTGKVSGSAERIEAVDLPARLAQQNDLRKKHGLPPLPDPAAVTADKPATR